MVLGHVPRHIPGRGRRQHQQGVNHQQPHPSHGQGDHHGNGDGEHRLLPEHLHPTAVRQGRVYGGEHQLVEGQNPQQHHQGQNGRQQANLSRLHRQNIADEQAVEFGEGAPPQGGQEDAKRHSSGGEDTDDGIAGQMGSAAH